MSISSDFLFYLAFSQLVAIVAVASELRQATYSIPGSGKCSTDEPYTVKNTINTKCALECLHLVKCADFNYNKADRECVLFLHKPIFYDSVPGCAGFKASQLVVITDNGYKTLTKTHTDYSCINVKKCYCNRIANVWNALNWLITILRLTTFKKFMKTVDLSQYLKYSQEVILWRLLFPCIAYCEVFIMPSGTLVPGGLMFLFFSFFSYFFFSLRDLRAPSADQRETLPRDQNYVHFYNPGPKNWGSPNKSGGQNVQNSGWFRTTWNFDREYLRNG